MCVAGKVIELTDVAGVVKGVVGMGCCLEGFGRSNVVGVVYSRCLWGCWVVDRSQSSLFGGRNLGSPESSFVPPNFLVC